MKYIFTVSFLLLIVSSIATWISTPQKEGSHPVLYWVTDPNPVRDSQVDAFHKWMKINVPVEDHYELRVDSANTDKSKKIIQSVSGVGGDIMDISTASGDMQYFHEMNIIHDLTAFAQEMNFSPDYTYPGVAPALQVNGKQFMFPCNIYTNMYWVNVDTMKKFNVDLPQDGWSFADFETLAQQFIAQAKLAHPEMRHNHYFLLDRIEEQVVMRNWGIDFMNETLTDSMANHPAFEKTLKLHHRWVYDLHILPSSADRASISSGEATHGGSGPGLFRAGNFGMYLSGRWALTQFRQWKPDPKAEDQRAKPGLPWFADMTISVLPPPQDGYQNTTSGSRAAVMYNGYSQRRKKLAAYFFQFLASKEYNLTIVDSADAIPPTPAFAQLDEYKKPAAYPNENGIHEKYSNALSKYGVLMTHSPFISAAIVNKECRSASQAVMADPSKYTPEEAVVIAYNTIKNRIQLRLQETPSLVPLYNELCKDQEKIDACKAAGKKIPRELIKNRYYLGYYEAKGMLE